MRGSGWRSRLGALAWLLGVAMFFVVQVLAGLAWKSGYSWSANNVSDLGNVRCQMWDPDHLRYVCSPLHGAVNASFMAQGASLMLGAILLSAIWSRPVSGWIARGLIILAGLGWVLAGTYPADVDLNPHVLAALLIFFLGNGALVLALRGSAGTAPAWLRRTGALAGAVGILAAVSFLGGRYLGLGMGGLERVAIFPLQLWAAAVAVWTLRGGHGGASAEA